MQFTRYQKRFASWALIGAITGLFVWLLSPVLLPFLVAWILAYALNPLVNRLDGWFNGRMPRWLSVVMIDLDHFKRINDTYGHQAGDECLARVADVLKQTVRTPNDVVSRYGGEEFALILPGMTGAEAAALAEAWTAA